MTDGELSKDQRRFLAIAGLTPAKGAVTPDDVSPVTPRLDRFDLSALAGMFEYGVFALRYNGEEGSLEDVIAHLAELTGMPGADPLFDEDTGPLLPSWVAARKAIAPAEAEVARLRALRPDAEVDQHIAASLAAWAGLARRGADWFLADLAATVPDPAFESPEGEAAALVLSLAVRQVLERAPLAQVTPADITVEGAPNPDGGKIAAPDSIFPPAERLKLFGAEGLNVFHSGDIAGTGGIASIKGSKDSETGVQTVEIEGEILPGLQEDRLGLESAGFFKYHEQMERAGLRMHVAGDPNPRWERLHLWGPGFGDEAAAGIYLGPRGINQHFQNKGAEKLIRHLGKLVLPLRDNGYRLMCKAEVETWPAADTILDEELGVTCEPIFREVVYTVRLITPDHGEGVSAMAGLVMEVEPRAYNQGAPLRVSLRGNGADWPPLFDLIPKSLPD